MMVLEDEDEVVVVVVVMVVAVVVIHKHASHTPLPKLFAVVPEMHRFCITRMRHCTLAAPTCENRMQKLAGASKNLITK